MGRKKKSDCTEGEIFIEEVQFANVGENTVSECMCGGGCDITNAPDDLVDETFDMAEHTCISFCCRDMMKLILGGQGQACGISMKTGEVQIGGINASYCPYCGQTIIVGDVPKDDGADVEE